MLLLFDNYDSFTYNIYQLLASLGAAVEVVRNDALTPEEVLRAGYEAVILSPGPGLPKEAGNLEALIEAAKGKVPLLGICLGHQAIGEVFGGRIVRAREIVHGKPSPIRHTGQGLYAGLPENAAVGRYHSLIIERASLPDCLAVTSELADGTIMGVRHKEYAIEGIQFHPESILTPDGEKIMRNFLQGLA